MFRVFLEHLKFTRNDDISNLEVSVLEYDNLLGIVFTGRTHHFTSCTNFTGDVKMLSNIRTPPCPSSINRQEHLFYGTPTGGCFRLEHPQAITFVPFGRL